MNIEPNAVFICGGNIKLHKIVFVIITLLISFQINFGQDFVENENWVGVIEGGRPDFLHHSFRNYSKQDVINAKGKLELIRKIGNKSEWEGSYSLSGELSENKLIWNSEVGFLSYYIYTCAIELRALNYGKIVADSDSITLISDKSQPPLPETGKTGRKTYIKVKWGERHYLVEEEYLKDFCELAAGYYEATSRQIETDGEKFEHTISLWNSFWVKDDEPSKKKVFGLPVLPKPYERFTKSPIEAKIISVEKIKSKQTDENNFSSITHHLKINVGTADGVEKGMSFYIPELRERITIKKVYKNTSLTVLIRDYDGESKKEKCFTIGTEIPCLEPLVGMKAKTIPAELAEFSEL